MISGKFKDLRNEIMIICMNIRFCFFIKKILVAQCINVKCDYLDVFKLPMYQDDLIYVVLFVIKIFH